MNTLKPCPFCGGGTAYYRKPSKIKNSAFVAVSVECRDCGAQPYAVAVYEGESEEEMQQIAAERWNRRVIQNE